MTPAHDLKEPKFRRARMLEIIEGMAPKEIKTVQIQLLFSDMTPEQLEAVIMGDGASLSFTKEESVIAKSVIKQLPEVFRILVEALAGEEKDKETGILKIMYNDEVRLFLIGLMTDGGPFAPGDIGPIYGPRGMLTAMGVMVGNPPWRSYLESRNHIIAGVAPNIAGDAMISDMTSEQQESLKQALRFV